LEINAVKYNSDIEKIIIDKLVETTEAK